MAIFKDLTGQKFGRLIVTKVSRQVQKANRTRYYWLCQCDCGNEKEVRTDCLTSGLVQSCGCIKKEQDRINLTKFHRHKMSSTRIYHIWQKMKDRCLNPKVKSYVNYGGRGIKICDEWLVFDNFGNWAVSHGYDDNLQIDRINNNKGYSPDNCRWISVKENCRNRRSNVVVEYQGESVTLIELAEKTNISYGCLHARYSKGDRGIALIRPVKK